MRDPARIHRVLAALGKYWGQNPDLRLFQILGNLADEMVGQPAREHSYLDGARSFSVYEREPNLTGEAYNVEDDKVLEVLLAKTDES